jgi:hypothetical protein
MVARPDRAPLIRARPRLTRTACRTSPARYEAVAIARSISAAAMPARDAGRLEVSDRLGDIGRMAAIGAFHRHAAAIADCSAVSLASLRGTCEHLGRFRDE